jgi:AraC-like DNA-binding protein
MTATNADGTLSSIDFAGPLQSMARLGLDTDAIATRARLSPDLLADPAARLPVSQEHAFWAAAVKVSGDLHLGLKVGAEHARNGTRSLLEYLVVHSLTMRDALAAVQRLVSLVDDRGHIDVTEEGDSARVGIRRDGLTRAPSYVEMLYATFATFYVEHVEGFRLTAVAFTHGRPAAIGPYQEALGVVPEFEAGKNSVVFPRRFLDATIRGADPDVGRYLTKHAEVLLERLPTADPFIEAVRRALGRAFDEGRANPEFVAKAAGVSVRTLRRRLSALGTSYHGLVDDLRREHACHRLEHTTDSVDAIADRLGFSSRTAFQRAFRRYTGVTPSEYRARRIQRPAGGG